jgi:hypothetical protein
VKLKWIDYFGKTKYAEHYWIYPQSWIEKEGDIYQCQNEECPDYQEKYYTHGNNDELHEGYPC